jgi:hypothetical protein
MSNVNKTLISYMKEFKIPEYNTNNTKDNRVQNRMKNKFDYLLNSDTDQKTIINNYDIIKKDLPRTLETSMFNREPLLNYHEIEEATKYDPVALALYDEADKADPERPLDELLNRISKKSNKNIKGNTKATLAGYKSQKIRRTKKRHCKTSRRRRHCRRKY